jgi:thiosulfate/3-mercaptopyruvate sulfurtransferase
VTFDELQGRIGEPHFRLLDARSQGEYDKGHIPGAVRVDPRTVEKIAAKPGALTDRAAWEAWIAPLGIGPDTEVLVYDANRQLDAARLWWLLRYLGIAKVGLIDGGVTLWEKQGRTVTTETRKVEPRKFEIRFRTDRLATRDEVLGALKQGKVRVIDARSQAEHTGVESTRNVEAAFPRPATWSGLSSSTRTDGSSTRPASAPSSPRPA